VSANRATPQLLFKVNPSPSEFDRLPGGWDVSASADFTGTTRGTAHFFVLDQRDHVGVELEKDAFVGFLQGPWGVALTAAGTIVGILAAVAIFIGAMAGWWSGSSAAEPEQVLPAAAPPKEKAPPSFSELWTDPAPYAVRTRSDRGRRTNPAPDRTDRRQLAASEAEAQLIKPPQDVIEPVSADPLAPEEVTAAAVKASMPLPHSTVARTLDRIGYRCGSVASATPVEGASGTYNVTCSSGQSFQAKPVNGRYRFRRLR